MKEELDGLLPCSARASVPLPPRLARRLRRIPNEIVAKMDPEQIKIVFNNILTNAVKFSDSNSDPIRITVKRRPPHVVVQIVDNGIGIPADELPFIFEPFYRVDESRTSDIGGTGLGLAIVDEHVVQSVRVAGDKVDGMAVNFEGLFGVFFFEERAEPQGRNADRAFGLSFYRHLVLMSQELGE